MYIYSKVKAQAADSDVRGIPALRASCHNSAGYCVARDCMLPLWRVHNTQRWLNLAARNNLLHSYEVAAMLHYTTTAKWQNNNVNMFM